MAILTALLSLTLTLACTGGAPGADTGENSEESTSTSSSATRAPDGVARTTVVVPGDAEATVVAADLTKAQSRPLKEWGGLTVSVGEPVEISLAEPIPARGVVLSRTYNAPLPAGTGATFGYFDTTLGTWRAVPSKLSADRMTLMARVHHLSVWTDFVGWASGTVDDVANWTAYQIGKIFDTRVDPPNCAAGTPSWVKQTIFIETNRNNPLLFCTGHDTKHPDLLVVKARVNRGYGYAAAVDSDTQWTYNSTFANSLDIDDLLAAVGHPGDAAFNLLQTMSQRGVLIGPGEEFSFGLNEQDSWLAGDALLKMEPPDAAEYLTWLLANLLVTSEVDLKSSGLVAAVIGISGCVSDLRAVRDAASAARAAASCVTAIDEDVARHLATALDKRGVKDAGRLAGQIAGKITVYLALLGPVYGTMTYFADTQLDPAARTVSVFLTSPPRVTRRTLLTAQVPSNCRLPAQRLVNGETTKGSPGSGSIGTKPTYIDMAGLGYSQALTTYWCTAGGVSWPETLLLVGAGGDLLGSFDLGDLGHHEHADVDSVSVSGPTAVVKWAAYEGAGFYVNYHTSRVTYSDGEIRVADSVTGYGDAPGFGEALANAASVNDRSLVAGPAAIPDKYWRILVKATAGRDPIVTCGWPSDNPGDCGISFAPTYEDEAYFLVSKRQGRWSVDYASTSVD